MNVERTVHTIDAQDQIAGRLASRIAVLLQGKHKVTYQPHIDGGDIVSVENVRGMKFSGRKLTTKWLHRFTGYPGGIRSVRLGEFFSKQPEKLLRMMVYTMLPKNKLRAKMLNRLQFSRTEPKK